MKNIDKLKELRKKHTDMNEFAREAADKELTISMSMGRRLYHQLKPKEDQNGSQSILQKESGL